MYNFIFQGESSRTEQFDVDANSLEEAKAKLLNEDWYKHETLDGDHLYKMSSYKEFQVFVDDFKELGVYIP